MVSGEREHDQKIEAIAQEFEKFVDSVVKLPPEKRRAVLEMQETLRQAVIDQMWQVATDSPEG